MQYSLFENEQGHLVFPAPSPTIPMAHVDSAGRVRQGNATGSMPMVEDSAAAHLLQAQYIRTSNILGVRPTFGIISDAGGVTPANNAWPRIFQVPVVTDAAGDSVATALVAGLAGYQACARLLYIFADATDAAWDAAWTCAPTGGFDVSPPDLVGLASVVNTIAPDWTPGGLYFQATTDEDAIQVTIANGGNVVTYYFVGVYWYET